MNYETENMINLFFFFYERQLNLLQDPQSTRYMTEDLYIDDELESSNLNYNLVLLGDNYEYLSDSVSHDDLRLLQTTEL